MKESNKLVKVSGEGIGLEGISSLYIDYIRNDFNMTISEMASYLSCSYGYVQKNIAPNIKHVLLNDVARKALFEYERESEYNYLFTKRKLFSRSDFNRFIIETSELIVTSERYCLDDLNDQAKDALLKKAKQNEEKAKKIYFELAQKATPTFYNDTSVRVEKMNKIPEQLYSLKDLTNNKLNLAFNYNIEVYRFLKKKGVPKVSLQSLVRYRKEDLERDVVFTLPININKREFINLIEKDLLGK